MVGHVVFELSEPVSDRQRFLFHKSGFLHQTDSGLRVPLPEDAFGS